MREIRGEGRNLTCLLSSPSPLSLLTRWLCYYFDRKEMKTRRFMIYVKIQRKSVIVDENQSETVKIKTNFNSNGIVPQKFQNNASFFVFNCGNMEGSTEATDRLKLSWPWRHWRVCDNFSSSAVTWWYVLRGRRNLRDPFDIRGFLWIFLLREFKWKKWKKKDARN